MSTCNDYLYSLLFIKLTLLANDWLIQPPFILQRTLPASYPSSQLAFSHPFVIPRLMR